MVGKIKCISWYENIAADKNFYLGLRTQPEKTKIIGAQLFVKPHTMMNFVPDEKEIPFKVVPDKILVNGSGYRFDIDKACVDIGPSFRYRHLFDSEVNSTKRDFVLVIIITFFPSSAADIAAEAPASPDPIISTSVFIFSIYLNSNLISELFI